MTFGTLLSRMFRLRCPSCGGDRVFNGLLGVKERCGACGFNCRPEGGYYLGAIYINYGVTSMAALGVGFPLAVLDRLATGVIAGSIVALVVALGFFQTSRSLWLGLHFWFSRPR